MAAGLLGKQLTNAGSYTTVYTVPASGVQFATVFINAVNTGTADAKINVGVTTASTPGAGEFLDYQIPLTASGAPYEYPCLVMGPGEKVMVYSNQSTVAVRVHGIEQS